MQVETSGRKEIVAPSGLSIFPIAITWIEYSKHRWTHCYMFQAIGEYEAIGLAHQFGVDCVRDDDNDMADFRIQASGESRLVNLNREK